MILNIQINHLTGKKSLTDIFKDGGFDIVIGNPPYVRHQELRNIKPYLKNNFKTYNGIRSDLYVYFFEKGLIY